MPLPPGGGVIMFLSSPCIHPSEILSAVISRSNSRQQQGQMSEFSSIDSLGIKKYF